MRLLHISDTHSRHRQLTQLPDADLIVHSGDITEHGTEEEVIDFIEWFESLDYQYRIFIAGNHDTCLWQARLEGLSEGTFYLSDTHIELDGFTFFGLPMFVPDIRTGDYDHQIQMIPSNIDVLITHQPPLGILDGKNDCYGSMELLQRVYEIQPRYHLFGHAHDSRGVQQLDGICFSNEYTVGEVDSTNQNIFYL